MSHSVVWVFGVELFKITTVYILYRKRVFSSLRRNIYLTHANYVSTYLQQSEWGKTVNLNAEVTVIRVGIKQRGKTNC